MKANIPHQFFIYAAQFSRISMIHWICHWARYVFNQRNSMLPLFACEKKYSVIVDGKPYHNKVMLLQTWLIDMIYDLSVLGRDGFKSINESESLHLVALYNDYQNIKDGKNIRNQKLTLLNLYGFLGEQRRFQSAARFLEDFSREKYILDVISYQQHPENTYKIDVKNEFLTETGLSTNEYALLLFTILSLFSKNHLMDLNHIAIDFSHTAITTDNIKKLIVRYSITLDDIRKSPQKRQVLYLKPIIKTDDKYMIANPFLLLSLFTNAEYWVIRDSYLRKKSQHFLNAFGTYFEMYVEEILTRCLPISDFNKIETTGKEQRADWYLKLGTYDILVEQKSGLSLLGIKQNHPNIEQMITHINKNWGEAVVQLHSTQKALNLSSPIKMILVYEDYYKSECLDQLFKLGKVVNMRTNEEIENDGTYWLVTINEFETLLALYVENPELALSILAEKDNMEKMRSSEGRELLQLFFRHDIDRNLYLHKYGIYDEQFEKLIDICG